MSVKCPKLSPLFPKPRTVKREATLAKTFAVRTDAKEFFPDLGKELTREEYVAHLDAAMLDLFAEMDSARR